MSDGIKCVNIMYLLPCMAKSILTLEFLIHTKCAQVISPKRGKLPSLKFVIFFHNVSFSKYDVLIYRDLPEGVLALIDCMTEENWIRVSEIWHIVGFESDKKYRPYNLHVSKKTIDLHDGFSTCAYNYNRWGH